MDAALQRLLAAEAKAEATIDEAQKARERVIDEAMQAARDAEQRFETGRLEIRAPFMKEAEIRAEQAVTELTQKCEERRRTLREMASRHEQDALQAALNVMLDPER